VNVGHSELNLAAGLVVLGLVLLARSIVRRSRGQSISSGEIFPSIDSGKDAASADQVLFDATQRLLDTHVSSSDVLDGRATTTLSTGSTVLPVTIGLLNLLKNGQSLSIGTRHCVKVALAAYVVLLISVLTIFLIRNLSFRPNIETLRGYTDQGYDGATLRRWVAEEYVRSIEENRTRLLWKSRVAFVVTVALIVEALALAGAAYFTVR
jgi:hypothetical protein